MGFSHVLFIGVLFAMKVLTTHYTPPGLHYALGFVPVPSRWIYWAELVLISVLYPNISFTGNSISLSAIFLLLFFIYLNIYLFTSLFYFIGYIGIRNILHSFVTLSLSYI